MECGWGYWFSLWMTMTKCRNIRNSMVLWTNKHSFHASDVQVSLLHHWYTRFQTSAKWEQWSEVICGATPPNHVPYPTITSYQDRTGTTVLSGRLNAVKGLKWTNQIVSFRRSRYMIDLWRIPVGIYLAKDQSNALLFLRITGLYLVYISFPFLTSFPVFVFVWGGGVKLEVREKKCARLRCFTTPTSLTPDSIR